jgi:hypothetical protein
MVQAELQGAKLPPGPLSLAPHLEAVC